MNRWVEVCYQGMLVAFLVGVVGCGSAPTRFYVLDSLPNPGSAGGQKGPSVGVGPVELPQYLDRPQIVTQSSENRLELSEFDQWAEPLQDNFTRVLGENLGTLLPTDHVFLFPWRSSNKIDYQVMLEVNRFIGTPGGEAHLVVRWTIIDETVRKTLLTRRSSYSGATGGVGSDALAAALSRNIAALSRDVAAAIRTLEVGKNAKIRPKKKKRRSRAKRR